MQPHRLALLASLISATAFGANANGRFDNLYTFGDSLTDTGSFGSTYKFVANNQTSLLYNQQIAKMMGIDFKPFTQGGGNYAISGSQTEGTGVAVDQPLVWMGTKEQINTYLSDHDGKADKNGLYILWTGGNDISLAIMNNLLSPYGEIDRAVGNVAEQTQTLLDNGAGTVIVPNIPNIADTPFLPTIMLTMLPLSNQQLEVIRQELNTASTPDEASRKTAIVNAMAKGLGLPGLADSVISPVYDFLHNTLTSMLEYNNQQTEQALSQLHGNIVRADVSTLFHEVLEQPQAFGFKTTVGFPCSFKVFGPYCNTGMNGYDDSQLYMFSDEHHPSPYLHQIIAEYFVSILDAPLYVSSLIHATEGMVEDARSTLDGQYQTLRTNQHELNDVQVFGGYSSHYLRRSGKNDSTFANAPSNDSTNNGSIGISWQMSEYGTAGVMISGGLNHNTPTENFSYNSHGISYGLFTQWQAPQGGWLNADMHYTTANLENIERQITLGLSNRTESGDTKARQYGGRIGAGWDIPVSSWLTTGPVLGYSWDKVHVDGYRESGNRSTSMHFSDQNKTLQTGSVGWRFDMNYYDVKPYLQVDYQRQLGDRDSKVSAAINSTATSFTTSTDKGRQDSVKAVVGANFPLNKTLKGYISTSYSNQNRDDMFSYTLGLSASF